MRFARVQGYVRQSDINESRLHLTVTLDTGRTILKVREEDLDCLRPLAGPDDLIWHADQWTQETIGVDLAEQGWEVVGAGPLPDAADGFPIGSAIYAVRNLG